jgi:hypothetical protein
MQKQAKWANLPKYSHAPFIYRDWNLKINQNLSKTPYPAIIFGDRHEMISSALLLRSFGSRVIIPRRIL